MQSIEEILSMLTGLLVDEFEIPAEDISLETKLYEELDLDSIDAVDLVVRLREMTGKKIDPEAFKQVRTVADIVDALAELSSAA